MKRYLNIFKILVKNSFSLEAQYRKDTWIKMIMNLFWISIVLFAIEIIFTHTNSIAGWEKGEVYVMTVIWLLIDELYTMFFGSNLGLIPDIITDGSLDLNLTKPANTLFLVSTHFFLVRSLYRCIMVLIVLFFVIGKFNLDITTYRIFVAIPLIIAGIIIEYALILMLNTLSFWFLRIDNINDLFGSIIFMGRYPVEVFPKLLKIIAYTAIPLVFIGYVPAAALFGKLSVYIILYAFILAGVLFLLSTKFWNFALKRYSSASS